MFDPGRRQLAGERVVGTESLDGVCERVAVCCGTSSPVTSSTTSSGMPPVWVATVGTPAAMASMMETGTPSCTPLPRSTLGITNTS